MIVFLERIEMLVCQAVATNLLFKMSFNATMFSFSVFLLSLAGFCRPT